MLYSTTLKNISRHIENTHEDNELDGMTTGKQNFLVQHEWTREVERSLYLQRYSIL